MATNISVVVRVRPLREKELRQPNQTLIEVLNEKDLIFDPKEELPPSSSPGVQQPSNNDLKRANKEVKYSFERIFGPGATNQDVFENTTKDMLAALMDGYNCSVFAYGATGAGKTFTMTGNKENPGITYLTMDHLFQTIIEFQMYTEFKIEVSYIEVYNENVFDLLKPSSTPLQLRDHHEYGVTVAGLSIHKVQTAQELLDKLEYGNRNRNQHPTGANPESSRGHAVFQVYVKMRCRTSGQCRKAKLSLIDLAGSERASVSGCVGERFKEGANINRSLLAFGLCINRLAGGNTYIPYRNSKLTRLLKDSLGKNCKTVMIANVSPSSISYEDTYNTLKYAARAYKIKLRSNKNIIDGNMQLNKEQQRRAEETEGNTQEIMANFERKIKELTAKLALSTNHVTVERTILEKQASWSGRINELELVHGALETKLLTLMSQHRVVALRRCLRTRAFEHVADLARRSSCDALEQICTNEFSDHERSAENYVQRHGRRNDEVMVAWKNWAECDQQLYNTLEECLADCPYMIDYVEKIKHYAVSRMRRAQSDLNNRLCLILKDEIKVYTECLSDAFNMLKKMYQTLKGYEHASPDLTMEFLEIIKKVKSAKSVSWSDEIETDPHFKFISTLDIDNPTLPLHFNQEQEERDTTIDVTTVSDYSTVNENCDPCPKKCLNTVRTPFKLQNNENIIINDSFESLDAQNINYAKKLNKDPGADVENLINFAAHNPADGQNMDALRTLPVEVGSKEVQPEKRVLTDRTKTIQRTVNFDNDNKALSVEPEQHAGAALPETRRAAFGNLRLPMPVARLIEELKRAGISVPETAGFTSGSSVARGGSNFRPVSARIVEPGQHAGAALPKKAFGHLILPMPVARLREELRRAGIPVPETAPFASGSSMARGGSNFRPVSDGSAGKAERVRKRTRSHPYSRPASTHKK